MAKPQIHLEHGTSKIGNKQRYAFDIVLIGEGGGQTNSRTTLPKEKNEQVQVQKFRTEL